MLYLLVFYSMNFILIFLLEVCSIGGSFDPVTNGISLRIGQSTGYRLHLVAGFGKGEKDIDYYYYDDVPRKPFHWTNLEGKIEYYFRTTSWFQPYIGVGIAYRDAGEWIRDRKYEGDSTYWEMIEKKENYKSWVFGIGVEFNYFSEIAKDVPFISNLSFQIEFPVIYYKFRNEVSGYKSDYDYYDSDNKSYTYGIGGGAGIHYNF